VTRVRLATFNILHGRSVRDGRVDLDRFADAIRRIDADVLALQEVDRDQPRSHHADLAAVAAAAMGAREYRYAAALAGTPGESWVPATGAEPAGTATYGVALLSRFPAGAWRTIRMRAIPVRVPMRLPAVRRIAMVREEPRVAVLARLDTPLGPLTAVATHLAFVPGWNRLQLRRLAHAVSPEPDPLVLMGDLNLTDGRPTAVTRYRALGAAATFPADRPQRQLDHVLLRGGAADVSLATAMQLPVSDHRALMADVERLVPAAP
jgi:endonuclease/exonuclease/phosphatase family metal-dependent hydrolase